MERMENVKKKHHFVFQAYLSKWKENNAVWVLRDKKKLFPTGTEAIAFKNSFYTINSLNSDHDIDYQLLLFLSYKHFYILHIYEYNYQ